MRNRDDAEKRVRVLVFPCGAESASEIHGSLRFSKDVELFGASSADDHGRFRFDRYFGDLPNIQHPDFDRAFSSLIETLGIDVVFATHDSVAEYLAPRAKTMGFHLVNGDPQTTFIARRKSATYGLFAGQSWVPTVYHRIDDIQEWPIVVKPDLGQGGQGVTLVNDPSEAHVAVARILNPILVEYLPGHEMTVDCFTDRHRTLRWIGPRTRERIRAGIAMRSRFVASDADLEMIASPINSRLRFRGPWFFQVKLDSADRWKLLEISCKIGGATVASRARGINLPLMTVQDYLGRDVSAAPEMRIDLVDRNIATRAELHYEYHTVFVELDGTLLVGGHATPQVVAFLYQSIRDGKLVKLLTRRESDVCDVLSRARVGREIFDDIVHVSAAESKADHVKTGSILIDNDLDDRLDVFQKCGVPAMGVDALEFFLR